MNPYRDCTLVKIVYFMICILLLKLNLQICTPQYENHLSMPTILLLENEISKRPFFLLIPLNFHSQTE